MLLLLFCNIHLKYLDITKQDYSCVQTLRNVTAVTIQTRAIVTIVTQRHSHLRILLRLRIFSILCCSLNLYFSKRILMSLCPSPNLVPFQVQSPPKTNTTCDCQNLELGCHEIFYKICWVENVSRCDWDSDSLLRRILHSAAPGGGAHSSQCGPWAGSGAGFRLHKPAPVSRQSTGCHHHTHSLISGENRKITLESIA